MEIMKLIDDIELKICVGFLLTDLTGYHSARPAIKEMFDKIRKYNSKEAIITCACLELNKWIEKNKNFENISLKAFEELEERLKAC